MGICLYLATTMRLFVSLLILFVSLLVQAGSNPFQLELERFAQMKPRELIRTMQERVDLLRFKKDGMDPKLMEGIQDIPEMPESMYRQFKQDILFGAAGIYLSPHDIRFGVKRPTIILREDTTPWVLIHEYTHFLLDDARHARNEINLDESLTFLKDNLDGFVENFNSFKANGSKFRDHRHESETGVSLITASKLRMQLMNIYELEEIVIESSLRQIYESGTHHNLDLEDYENSDKYIASNKDSVRRGLSYLHDSISALNNAWSQSDIRSTLTNLQSQMAQILKSVTP